MLGNFSFGDYFKERAIELAWKLITKEFGLQEGQAARHRLSRRRRSLRSLEEDRGLAGRAHRPHREVGQFLGDGRTGPCGPCSEIFIDRGEHIWGGPPGSPEEDGDRYIEMWNLVFMQFEQVTREERESAAEALDRHRRGAGAHRCHAAGQVDNNYDIDLFRLADRCHPALTRRADPQEQHSGFAPRDRRPSARLGVLDRRWRFAFERGPRLRAAADHAPSDAPCAVAGRA